MTVPMKYARLERERRWRLVAAPPLPPGLPTARLLDRYLDGTRLRLRTVLAPGQPEVHKLGQKVPADPAHPSTVAHTTIYLSRTEFSVLEQLPAQCLTKTRTWLPWEGRVLALDVFEGGLTGLVLAEVEIDADGASSDLPFPDATEVTDDSRFTGGALAALNRAQAVELLGGPGSGIDPVG